MARSTYADSETQILPVSSGVLCNLLSHSILQKQSSIHHCLCCVFPTLNMALALEIEKQFTQLSERVKSVDLHPTEPWILASLYSGTVCIWNYQSQTMEKSFKVTESPVRSAKFIARKHWIVTASDDKFVRAYDWGAMELIKEFEAHKDFIRCVTVHPSLPYVLSSSDDTLIKKWDWEKDWECTQIFEGHSHYVMQSIFNPRDSYTFASASLDGTIKIWNLGSPAPIATLECHSKGINCIDYLFNDDKLHLLSGSDDYTVKVWDCETKSCIQTLESHTNNVCAISAHPEFPIIISGSEDATICIWNAKTFRLENTLNYGLERVWAVGCKKDSQQVAFGCDKGSIMVKVNGSN
ncbi:coatomer beta subunit, putative [Ricinus communis]|uniref:Beta'-coat protein n=2 Tax=Ricinus communis TaxID=3988 RepID=B9SQC1_RICCO|nr:coatomer beta subunit, putative [Ricinus communis]